MRCSICNLEMKHPIIKDYSGNNPWPVRTNENARCCDSCNNLFVIPARLMFMHAGSNDAKEKLIEKFNKSNIGEIKEIIFG